MVSCTQREWAVEGGGLYGYLIEPYSQLASRSVLNDFTDDALTIPAGNIFKNGTS